MREEEIKSDILKFKTHKNYFLDSDSKQYRNKYVFKFIERFNLDKRILNVGDGIGTISLEFENKGFRNITSIDIELEFLELAKKRCKYTKFEIMDAENLSFKYKFDIITYVDVVEYLDIEKVFSQIDKIIGKNGEIYLENFNILFLKYLRYVPFLSKIIKTHKNYKLNSHFKIFELASKYNFEIVEFACLNTQNVRNNFIKKLFYSFLLKPVIMKKIFSPVCYFYLKRCD